MERKRCCLQWDIIGTQNLINDLTQQEMIQDFDNKSYCWTNFFFKVCSEHKNYANFNWFGLTSIFNQYWNHFKLKDSSEWIKSLVIVVKKRFRNRRNQTRRKKNLLLLDFQEVTVFGRWKFMHNQSQMNL